MLASFFCMKRTLQKMPSENVFLINLLLNIFRRDTGQPAGYCFIEFRTEEEAERILKTVNGKEIPGTTPVGIYYRVAIWLDL